MDEKRPVTIHSPKNSGDWSIRTPFQTMALPSKLRDCRGRDDNTHIPGWADKGK
jgi:hypothetical protein